MLGNQQFVTTKDHRIGNVHHLEFPDTSSLQNTNKQKLGYSQRQCYWRLSGIVGKKNTVLSRSFIEKQQNDIKDNQEIWDAERNGNLLEQDYKDLALGQKLQLEHLHSIKDGMKSAVNNHPLASQDENGLFFDDYERLHPNCLKIAAFQNNDNVGQDDVLLLDKKSIWLVF